MASSSMVLVRTEPLSLHFFAVYGPSHLVLSFPFKYLYLESYSSTQYPSWNCFSLRCLSCHIFLWSWTTFVWSRAAIFVHLIDLAGVSFPFVHDWDLGPAELPFLVCCIQILLTAKPSSHRPTHRVWTLWLSSMWCYRPKWPQPIDLPNIFCCCSLP